MTDKDHHPLVPVSPGSIARTTDGAPGVLARMAADVLALERAKDLALEKARFRIGKHEFRGPDYRQILRWAEALDRSPEDVVGVLQESTSDLFLAGFEVTDGCISSLVWDFEKLPLAEFAWEGGLHIHTLVYLSRPPSCWIPGPFPAGLRELSFEDTQLEELILFPMPGLTSLACSDSHLTQLDLSPVPGLTSLACSDSHLTQLDLSPVPGLTTLICSNNQLTELDLSPVTGLTSLACSNNQLTELDLSPVPELTSLACSNNQLTELNLPGLPGLGFLNCSKNQLTALDLPGTLWPTDLQCRDLRSPMRISRAEFERMDGKIITDPKQTKRDWSGLPRLKWLDCSDNNLIYLNLPGLPKLDYLDCSDNQLTKLELSGVRCLTRLACSNMQLTELDVRLLEGLVSLNVDTDVRIIGNAPMRP